MLILILISLQVFAAGTPENGQTGMGSEGKEIRGKKEIFHYEYQPKEIDLFVEKEDGEVSVSLDLKF